MLTMILVAVAVAVAACGAPAVTPTTTPTAVPADPVRAAAERDCPAKYASECVPIYIEMAQAGASAALCVWPDYRWSFVTPEHGVAVGDYGCGTDGRGQIVALLPAR